MGTDWVSRNRALKRSASGTEHLQILAVDHYFVKIQVFVICKSVKINCYDPKMKE